MNLLPSITLALLWFALGCSKPCESADTRCVGQELQTCGQPCSDCDREWRDPVPCSGRCVTESELRAFCSLTADPEPRCTGRRAFCDDDLQVYCRADYPVSTERCPLPPGVTGKASCTEGPAGGLGCMASGMVPTPSDAGAMDGDLDRDADADADADARDGF